MNILVSVRGFDTRSTHAVGNFELDQAKALKAAGHDVRVAAIDTRSVRHRRKWGTHAYELDGIPVYYAASPAGGLPGKIRKVLQKKNTDALWKSIDASHWVPDIVHAHFGDDLLSIARDRGIPTVYTEHYSYSNQTTLSEHELQRELEVYAKADKLLCVSNAQAESILCHTGYTAEVVYNIVDTHTFARREKIPGEGFRFVSAGNAIHRKGYDLLLDALVLLRARGKHPSLTVIGGGDALRELQTQSERENLTDVVRFLGKQPREVIAEEFAKADAFVLASRMETFGVVYAEAMASGLPVIATVCGGPENFVTPETGMLIPTENVEALADAMEQMMDARERYDTSFIADYAQTHFSPEVMARRLTAVYEELRK